MKIVVMPIEQVYRRAAGTFAADADRAIRERARFAVALSGGSTPRPLYELLAQEYRDAIPWGQAYAFFGDERCVPPDHPDSNYRMADMALLSKVGIPPQNVHRMKGELPPDAGAADYSQELARFFGLGSGEVPQFDLTLLGMGENGHTASIFPGSDTVHNDSELTAVAHVADRNAYRLTLTPRVLRHSRHVIFLVTGRAKADTLKEVLEGPYDPDRLPAQLLTTADGEVTWIVDSDAGEGLSSYQDLEVSMWPNRSAR